jgi:hypothetical protein
MRVTLTLLAVVALASAGCKPRREPPLTFDSGLLEDLIVAELDGAQASQLCDAAVAFRDLNLPRERQMILWCTRRSIEESIALGEDIPQCTTRTLDCQRMNPPVVPPPCPPPYLMFIGMCNITVGEFEECFAHFAWRDRYVHEYYDDCNITTPEARIIDEVTLTPEPPECEDARRDCAPYFMIPF